MKNEYMLQYEKATGLPSTRRISAKTVENSGRGRWDRLPESSWDTPSIEVPSEGYVEWLELRAKAINQLFELTDAGMKLRIRGVIDDE